MNLKQINWKNIVAYIQGNVRYWCFYKASFLLKEHIREQISTRIESMDFICYKNGSCKLCGCKTTHLQMANKACDKPCYPYMLSKSNWKKILEGATIYDKHTGLNWVYRWGKFSIKE